MRREWTKDTLQGIALCMPRASSEDPADELVASGSVSASYTQAGPGVATPEPTSTNLGALGLMAGGTRAAGDPDLQVQLERGGLPQPIGRARQIWRTGTSGDWYGQDALWNIVGWTTIEYVDGTTSIDRTGEYHAMTTPDGTVVVAYRDKTTTPSRRVRVARRNNDGTWTKTTIYSQTAAPVCGFFPTIWAGEGGRLFLAHVVEDTNLDEANVALYTSDDDAVTWTALTTGALDEIIRIDTSSTGYVITRMRGAWYKGQTLLMLSLQGNDSADTYRDVPAQYASEDGQLFVHVETWLTDADQGLGCVELVTLENGFLLAGIERDDQNVQVRHLPSAWAPSSTAETATVALGPFATVSLNALAGGDLAMVVDADNTIYIARPHTSGSAPTPEVVGMNSSVDNGLNWDNSRQVQVFDSGDPDTYLMSYTLAAHEGRLLLVHQWAADPGDEDETMAIAVLGGYSTRTLPHEGSTRLDDNRWEWDQSWLPIELPDDLAGMTVTAAGTYTATLTTPGHLAVTTTTGTYSALFNTPGTGDYIDGGILVLVELQTVSGGAPGSSAIAAEIAVSDGAGADYRVRLQGYSTGIDLYDVRAGAKVGSSMVVDTTTGFVQVLLEIRRVGGAAGHVACYYRQVTTAETRRTWTDGPSSTTLTAGTGTSTHLAFGHLASGTASSRWRQAHLQTSTSLRPRAATMASGFSNPGDLTGAPLPRTLYPLGYGVRTGGRSGIGFAGDRWTVGTSYEHPITNILPRVEASPRRGWRSTQIASPEVIVWEANATTDTRTPRDIVVLALTGTNWRTGYLEARKAGPGTWTTLAIVDAAEGRTGLRYTRYGRTLTCNAAGTSTNTPWLPFHDGAGGFFLLDASTARKVTGQTSGYWDDSGSDEHTRPVLTLAGLDGTEPTSGSSGIYCAPRVFVAVHLLGENYSHFRLRIPGQVCPDAYFSIGTAFLGYLSAFGWRYDWPWAHELEDGTVVEEDAGGIITTYQGRPIRRLVDFAWSAGILAAEMGEGGDPDVLYGSDSSGAPGVATPQATGFDLVGAYREAGGARDPVLYVERVPRGPADSFVSPRRDAFILGRLMSAPRLEAVGGDEENPLHNVQTISIREDV